MGLSGGIDSALVATMAADAVGGEHVQGISMPSMYSSEGSKDDAAQLAENLGASYDVQPIKSEFDAFQKQLDLEGVAAENLQARIRGVIVMAYSNSKGLLALATGNKSELACGYSTIYGDAVGGYAPIKDVFKTKVWQLSRWRNKALKEGLGLGALPVVGYDPNAEVVVPPAASSSRTIPSSRHRAPNCGPGRRTPIRCPNTAFSTRCSPPILNIPKGGPICSPMRTSTSRRSTPSCVSSTAPNGSVASIRWGRR